MMLLLLMSKKNFFDRQPLCECRRLLWGSLEAAAVAGLGNGQKKSNGTLLQHLI